MIRALSLLLLIVLLAVGGLYAAYGEVDPCRVLAIERARRADANIGMQIHKFVEPWLRMETSQMSTGQCVRALVTSWRDRYSSDGGDSRGDGALTHG